VWKIPVPGIGHSSPAVWENRLFLTTAIPETREKVLLCYDTENGNLIWKRTVIKSILQNKHADNSYASGTPATDGRLVYVAFLDQDDFVVAAYDFTGKQVWLQRPGKFQSPHGFSCSPVLYEDKVIINGTSKLDPFFAALSKTDGKTIWKISHENLSHSFSTPIIREIAGKTQLIMLGNKQVASFNPDDGSKYWYVNGPDEDYCASPFYHEKSGLLILSTAWRKRIMVAIKPDGEGDVSQSHVAWQTMQGGHYVPSPICAGDFLFTTMTNGTVYCIDIASGDSLWTRNMGKQYPSPVLIDGLVYLPNDEGVISIIKPGSSFETVAVNPIGEKMTASPAPSNGKIYLRGHEHLYCIGKKK
jgi:outer membrane protein assembly factor BamB